VRYTVFWSEDPDFTHEFPAFVGTDTTYVVPPGTLQIQTMYYWRVEARTAEQQRWSDPAEGWSFFVVEEVTPVRAECRATAREDGILVTWTAFDAEGLNGFRVWRRPAESGTDEAWTCISPLLPPGDPEGSYLDLEAEPGVPYEYMVEAFGPGGSEGRFGPASASRIAPAGLRLALRPNPGAAAATVEFSIPRSGDALLSVYDARGREVARERLAGLTAGGHALRLEPLDPAGRRLPSGSYFVRLDTPSGTKTARWMLVR
jgi:hypothetical protein